VLPTDVVYQRGYRSDEAGLGVGPVMVAEVDPAWHTGEPLDAAIAEHLASFESYWKPNTITKYQG
jgi:hypothetical protein